MSKLTVVSGVCIFLGLAMTLPAQACIRNLAVSETTPTSDFVLSDTDGTALHVPTGLVWKRCAEGQTWDDGGCTGSPTEFTWRAALQRVETVNTDGFAGQNDWRLPNVKELQSIVERQCYSWALNPVVFPNTAGLWGLFWSSSPYAGSSGYAWLVSFGGGSASYHEDIYDYYALLVRSGQ